MRFIPIHFALVALFFITAPFCEAATLSTGALGTHTEGSTFTVPVFISAGQGEAINAVAATLIFPTDLLRIVSISDPGLVNLWAEKPSFSNANGTASFQGVIYNPGFSGANGKILNVTFKALSKGTGQIEFKSPSILANDGEGTEILSSSPSASVTITGSRTVPAALTTVTPPVPAAVTTSATTSTTTVMALPAQAEESQPPVTAPEVPTKQSLWVTIMALSMIPGFIVLFVLIAWLLWPRIVHLTRMIKRVLSSEDEHLQEEMYVIHYTLTEELKRLQKERQDRQLSMSERRIFMRFSDLQERMERLIREDTRKDGQ